MVTIPLAEFITLFSTFDSGIDLGFFPNRVLLNEYLNLGVQNEGMGNNAEWHPFSITQQGYLELVTEVNSKYKKIEVLENIKTIYQWRKSILNEFKNRNPEKFEKPINFYLPRDEYGEFSNFSNHGIEMDNCWWKTVEHYYQASKFDDLNYKEKIANANTPKIASILGKSRKYKIKENWEEIKDKVMYEAVLKKFTTHKYLTKILLDTNDRNLIENSPYDYYWGCGADKMGQNKLGKILEQVREDIRKL